MENNFHCRSRSGDLARVALGLALWVLAISSAFAQQSLNGTDSAQAVNRADVIANQLGSTSGDFVFTPVPPCRIVDTRNAGGPIAANTTRLFFVDESSFANQGGFDGSCGIPQGVAQAVAMTLTVTQPDNAGYFTAYPWPGPMPLASVLNFVQGQTIANTTIVPVGPFPIPIGEPPYIAYSGAFELYVNGADADAIADVVGYFAPPVATALDCSTVTSTSASCFGLSCNTDAVCPAGRTATGGGYLANLGFAASTFPISNGWRAYYPSSGNGTVTTYVNCCRIPGR